MYIFWFKKNIDVLYVSPNKQQKISWKLIVRKARKKQTKHKREKQTAGKKKPFFSACERSFLILRICPSPFLCPLAPLFMFRVDHVRPFCYE